MYSGDLAPASCFPVLIMNTKMQARFVLYIIYIVLDGAQWYLNPPLTDTLP